LPLIRWIFVLICNRNKSAFTYISYSILFICGSCYEEKYGVSNISSVSNSDVLGRMGRTVWGLFHFPIPTQNISSFTHHIKSFDTCMEH
jgi:hypothetical protein